MIKIATITIMDTGYINPNNSGAQKSFIANSGTAITLKGISIGFVAGQAMDNAPLTGSESDSTVSPVSSLNGVFTITGVMDRTSTTDMAKILIFNSLRQTKGLKLLYYNSTADDISAGGTDGWANVITELGSQHLNGETDVQGNTISDAHTANGGQLYNAGDPFPHLHCFVRRISIPQGATGDLLNFTLTIEVTK